MTLPKPLREACEVLKVDPSVLDELDRTLGFLLVGAAAASAVTANPTVAAIFTGLLTAKNELIKAARGLHDRLKGSPYEARIEKMKAAHTLIVHGSLLEAAHEQLQTLQAEHMFFDESGTPPFLLDLGTEPFFEPVDLPHSRADAESSWAHVGSFYDRAAPALMHRFSLLPSFQTLSSPAVAVDPRGVRDRACTLYEEYYFELARRHADFAIWANLHRHEEHRGLLERQGELTEEVRGLIEDARRVGGASFDRLREELNLTFQTLGQEIGSIPSLVTDEPARRLLEKLHDRYRRALGERILDQPPEIGAERDADMPNFPTLGDGFIAQAYRIDVRSQQSQLEREEFWSALPEHQDLVSRLADLVRHPDAWRSPILILGAPGSGKSLLTRTLAAHFAGTAISPIRVELQRVAAGADPRSQVESQLDLELSQSIQWGPLCDVFVEAGGLVLFDGYDELLQVGGLQHAHFLESVRDFQRNCTRPVRALITSRTTLIDRCAIPVGTVVIRLEAFDGVRIDRWCAEWNKANGAWLAERKRRPFELPDVEAVRQLAKEPLLLAMLALYDAQANDLRSASDMDRATLYDRIVRQFIRRQIARNEARGEKEEDRLEELEIAAVGVFNRGRPILEEELEDDLRRFEASCKDPARVFRGFFFVQKDQALEAGGTARERPRRAYSFVHKTFGEFLLADWICRRFLLPKLHDLEANERRWDEHCRNFFLDDKWQCTLSLAPLFEQPETLALAREWFPKLVKTDPLATRRALGHLTRAGVAQLGYVLNGTKLPACYFEPESPHARSRSIVARLATYSLNLVVLMVTLDPEPIDIDPSALASDAGSAEPWDRLNHLWRAWFPIESFRSLVGVMLVGRQDGRVVVMDDEPSALADLPPFRAPLRGMARAIGDTLIETLSTSLDSELPSRDWEIVAGVFPELKPGLAARQLLKLWWLGSSDAEGCLNTVVESASPDSLIALQLWSEFPGVSFHASTLGTALSRAEAPERPAGAALMALEIALRVRPFLRNTLEHLVRCVGRASSASTSMRSLRMLRAHQYFDSDVWLAIRSRPGLTGQAVVQRELLHFEQSFFPSDALRYAPRFPIGSPEREAVQRLPMAELLEHDTELAREEIERRRRLYHQVL